MDTVSVESSRHPMNKLRKSLRNQVLCQSQLAPDVCPTAVVIFYFKDKMVRDHSKYINVYS